MHHVQNLIRTGRRSRWSQRLLQVSEMEDRKIGSAFGLTREAIKVIEKNGEFGFSLVNFS